MQIQHFYQLLQNPAEQTDFTELDQLSSAYPYFSAAQMLCISYLYHTNRDAFSSYLKKFSHNIPNRKYFFQQLKKLKNTRTSPKAQTLHTTISFSKTPKEEPTVPASSPQNFQQELNKSLSETIIQKELLQINPILKEKAQELTTPENKKTDSAPSTPTTPDTHYQDTNTIEKIDTTQIQLEHSLSYLLKQLTNKKKQEEQKVTINKLDQNILSKPDQDNTHISSESDKKERIKKQQEIIDKIITNPPKPTKIIPQKFFSAENKARESLLETEDLVTETLAQIYASQGNIHKAIRAYEILCLKFPQKNSYFVAKIQELKNQLKK